MKNFIAIGNWKSLGFCLALIAGLFIYSCADDNDDLPPGTTSSKVPFNCSTCATTSQALPENDNLAKGIYKGVFPAGTIAINFKNDVETVNGAVYYKNKTIALTEVPEVVISMGKPVFAMLRGVSGTTVVRMGFSVNEDGSDPVISDFTITGEEPMISATIFKERSNSLIEGYEGNYFLSGSGVPSNAPDDTGRVDPGLVHPDPNATNVGTLKMVLSRSDGMYMLYRMMNGASGAVVDHGSINDGALVSDVSGKRISYIRGDELNYQESSSSGTVFLHAERKR